MGNSSICDSGPKLDECLTSPSCTGRGSRTTCDTSVSPKICVECMTNAHCTALIGTTPPTIPAANTQCVTATNRCRQCVTNANCAAGMVCSANNVCVACERDTDCTTLAASRCLANTCVPCASNEQCAHIGATPRCNFFAAPRFCI